MNRKRSYQSNEPKPEFYHDFGIRRGSKTYLVTKGTEVSVHRKPGLIAGRYEVLYGEWRNGVMLITVEGPTSRVVHERRRKMIRESDVKTVHVSTKKKS